MSSNDASKKERQMSVRIVLPATLALMVLLAGGTSAHAFFKKSPKSQGQEAYAQKEDLLEAIETKDYDAWKQLMLAGIEEKRADIESTTREEFEAFAADIEEQQAEREEQAEERLRERGIAEDDIERMKELKRSGDRDGLEALREELGLPTHEEMRGHGPKKRVGGPAPWQELGQ